MFAGAFVHATCFPCCFLLRVFTHGVFFLWQMFPPKLVCSCCFPPALFPQCCFPGLFTRAVLVLQFVCLHSKIPPVRFSTCPANSKNTFVERKNTKKHKHRNTKSTHRIATWKAKETRKLTTEMRTHMTGKRNKTRKHFEKYEGKRHNWEQQIHGNSTKKKNENTQTSETQSQKREKKHRKEKQHHRKARVSHFFCVFVIPVICFFAFL